MSTVPSPLNEAIPAGLQGIPLTMSVRIGTTKKPMREIASLSEGSLIVLDAKIDEPVDICIDDRVIAQGELVESDDGEGISVKIIKLVTPSAS